MKRLVQRGQWQAPSNGQFKVSGIVARQRVLLRQQVSGTPGLVDRHLVHFNRQRPQQQQVGVNFRLGGSFSLLALVACEAAFLAFYLAGSLFAGWRPLAAGVLFDLPLRLLVGYAAVNTALFVLAYLSPLGIIANFGILLAVAACLFVATRPIRRQSDDSVGLLVLGMALAAATLWCQDSLRPISVEGNTVVFKPASDTPGCATLLVELMA